MKVYENEEQRLVEEEERAKEKEKTVKEAGRRKRGHRKKRPMKKRVDELYKNFLSKETTASELERL